MGRRIDGTVLMTGWLEPMMDMKRVMPCLVGSGSEGSLSMTVVNPGSSATRDARQGNARNQELIQKMGFDMDSVSITHLETTFPVSTMHIGCDQLGG